MENTPVSNHETLDLGNKKEETVFFNKKDLKKNLLLFGITILIMIIFFEIILRMYYPQKLYDDCYE
jgi:hypothetical protein